MGATFSERGGGWVAAQSLLMFAAIALGPACRDAWEFTGRRPLGWTLVAIGAVFGIAGVITLGCSRTIFPKPLDDSALVRHGVYGLVRHPLYLSVVLLAAGWGLLWRSWPSLGIAVALVLLLDAKARREERWLREKFPGYADYQQRVRRFIPWLY